MRFSLFAPFLQSDHRRSGRRQPRNRVTLSLYKQLNDRIVRGTKDSYSILGNDTADRG